VVSCLDSGTFVDSIMAHFDLLTLFLCRGLSSKGVGWEIQLDFNTRMSLTLPEKRLRGDCILKFNSFFMLSYALKEKKNICFFFRESLGLKEWFFLPEDSYTAKCRKNHKKLGVFLIIKFYCLYSS